MVAMRFICEGPISPDAARLYSELVGRYGVLPEEFDESVETSFVQSIDGGFSVASRVLNPSECSRSQQIYQQALRFVDRCSAEAPDSLCRAVERHIPVPWFPSAGGTSPTLAKFSRWKKEALAAIDQELAAEGVLSGAPGREASVLHRMIARLLLPSAEGGWGISFDAADGRPPRTIEQIAAEKKVACLDFFTLCKSLDVPGIDVVPVVLLQDRRGRSRLHLMAGIKPQGSDELVAIMDVSEDTAELPERFYFGPPRVGDVYGVVSDLKLFGEYENRRGATSADREAALDTFNRVLSFDPFSDTAHYNLARRSAEVGRCEETTRHLAVTRATNPLFPGIDDPLEQCRLREKKPVVSFRGE